MQQLKLKLFELGKTRTNNASPDLFNFYVVLVGCDTAGLPRAGENSKPHHYKEVQKKKNLPKTCVLTGKQFEDFRRKKEQKHYSRPFKKPQWDTRTLKPNIVRVNSKK